PRLHRLQGARAARRPQARAARRRLHVHDRQPGAGRRASDADAGGRSRGRRPRLFAGHRRRPVRDPRGRARRADLPSPPRVGRQPQLLLEGAPGAVSVPGDVAALVALATRVAHAAVRIHRDGLGRTHEIGTKASPTDAVTEVDREAERAIVDALLAERPQDAVLAEEGARRDGTSGVRWIVDPLDGTTNYLYRYPAYAVSIGIEVDGALAAGVVHDSARDR